MLFRATAESLRVIAADPQHLGAEIGFFAVLHTWGQNLLPHPHLHWHRQKTMTLAAAEFIRRFLLHVLPLGFQRIRYYGFLGNRYRQEKLARCQYLLGMPAPEVAPDASTPPKDYRGRAYGDVLAGLPGLSPRPHARDRVLDPRPPGYHEHVMISTARADAAGPRSPGSPTSAASCRAPALRRSPGRATPPPRAPLGRHHHLTRVQATPGFRPRARPYRPRSPPFDAHRLRAVPRFSPIHFSPTIAVPSQCRLFHSLQMPRCRAKNALQ